MKITRFDLGCTLFGWMEVFGNLQKSSIAKTWERRFGIVTGEASSVDL